MHRPAPHLRQPRLAAECGCAHGCTHAGQVFSGCPLLLVLQLIPAGGSSGARGRRRAAGSGDSEGAHIACTCSPQRLLVVLLRDAIFEQGLLLGP